MDKHRLVAYMRLKNEIVFECTGLNLYSQEDYDELESWDDHDCFRILTQLQHAVTGLHNDQISISDASLCPQCLHIDLAKYGSCKDCKYGERHGICMPHKDSPVPLYLDITRHQSIAEMLRSSSFKQQLISILEETE